MTETLTLQDQNHSYTIPMDRIFTQDGCWLQARGCVVRMGLGAYLQAQVGTISGLALKEAGFLVKNGAKLGQIEGKLASLQLTAPLTGKLRELNPLIRANPALIQQEPYERGWIYELEAFDWDSDRLELLSPIAYFNHLRRVIAGEDEDEDA